MKPALKWMRRASLLTALLAAGSVAWAQEAAPAAQTPASPGYTTAEYNAYNTAKSTPDPAAKITALEAFIAEYNNPTLMPFAYRDLYTTYYAQKNYVKTIEYIDKLLALGDKVDAPTKLAALVNRGQAYGAGATDAALQTPDMLTKTRAASAQGLQALAVLAKPAAMAADAFENQKKAIGFVFNSVAGIAASYQKDWPGAINSFTAALTLNPQDATTHYRLGAAYLQTEPPRANEGFWELGRSIALNIPGTDQVKQFMRGRLVLYQQTGCERLVDDQINQVLTLSAAGGNPPADFNIPSVQVLQMARDDTFNFLPWLQEGGEHGHIMWLATCGLEFPDVAVRVMEMIPGDTPDQMTMKVFRAPTREEMMAATEPNMEIHIVGQPNASKLHKDDLLRFTGTLNGYQPIPFLLTWDECRINADDLSDLTTPVPAPAPQGAAAQ